MNTVHYGQFIYETLVAVFVWHMTNRNVFYVFACYTVKVSIYILFLTTI